MYNHQTLETIKVVRDFMHEFQKQHVDDSASPGRRPQAAKASSWIREEFDTDRAGTVTGTVQPGALLPADAAPEHFRLYAAVQKEWFQYDIYARVCMLLGFSSFVQSLSFYANGHIVVELRGFYVAHATAFVLEVLHVLLLRFDIIQGRVKSTDRTPAWICIFAAYICQFCYQLRILEVILPDDIRNPLKMEESIGDAWWPSAWRCPSAFAHVLYFVAPPARLQPGQFDLMREVKEGPQGNAFETAGVPLMETKPADTSEANPGMSAEEIAMQVQYLDRLFDYFQSDQVDATLSETNKERVKELYGEFANARRKGSGPEAMRVFQDSLMALEGIMAAEGMRHEGEPSTTDAGYTSASQASSGSSGSDGEEGKGEYSWDGRRLWKTETAVRLFSKKGNLEPWQLINIVQLVICFTWFFLILCMVLDVFIGDQGLKREASSGFISPPHSGDHEGGGGHSGLHFSREGVRRLSGVASPARLALQDLLDFMPGSQPAMETPKPISWPSFFEPRVLACGPRGIATLTPRGVGALIHQNNAQRFHLAGLTHLPPLLSAAFHPHAKDTELMVITRQGHMASCPEPFGVSHCAAHQGLPVPPGTRLVAAAAGWLRPHESAEAHLHDGVLLHSSLHKWGRASSVAQWQGACPMGGGLVHLRLRKTGEAWTPELLMNQDESKSRPAIFQ
eukprot:g23811.t1